MSGAIGKAAQQGAKAAQANVSVKGARRDPELFVRAIPTPSHPFQLQLRWNHKLIVCWLMHI